MDTFMVAMDVEFQGGIISSGTVAWTDGYAVQEGTQGSLGFNCHILFLKKNLWTKHGKCWSY